MLRLIPRDARPFDLPARERLRPYAGVTARLLYSRGVETAAQADAFLHPSLAQLHDPMRMSGMPEALRLIERARDERWATVVYGDYDVDGMCACALMTLALRRFGVNAQPHVPLRAEGYGLNAEAVRALAKDYKLLVTVDLGVTNHEEVRLAQSLGMRVVVTDHHGLALTQSPADAVMNPLLGEYPFRRLCGTGVAFKLAQALLGLEACEEYLDLAALATVADIVPLTDENRVLVSLGLPHIAARERVGLKALLQVGGDPQSVDADTLGYRLGPRLNAAGRLDDASKGVRLLMTEDENEAQRLASELDALNTERKVAESALVRQAAELARDHDFLSEPLLMVRGEGWNVGVIGLAAGRLCQQYACPTCVLSESDGLLHGSLRSVHGVHIHRCLQACDDLLLRYGGHELAAGVTLQAENYDAFQARLQAEVAKADPSSFVPAQEYDAELGLEDCSNALLDEMNLMAPFGCDNPSPLLLARGLAVEERRAVGADGAHLKLTLRQQKRVMGGIAFGMGGMAGRLGERVDAVFSLGQNTFRGVTSLQMDVKALVPEAGGAGAQDESGAVVDGLYDLMRLAGESVPAAENKRERRCTSAQGYEALRSALARGTRGMLIVCRTNDSAARVRSLGEMDEATRVPTDPRCFATLLTAPSIGAIGGHWRQAWLMDGELTAGESALWQARLPQAEIVVLETSAALERAVAALDAGDERYRALYRALRAAPVRSMGDAAQAADISVPQARVGMRAFAELGLTAYEESPFRYAVQAPVKCSLGDSLILHALRAFTARDSEG